MEHGQRIEALKSSLFDPIPPVWDEPFHEAWLAAEGETERIRLATAQAAEMAAARPVLKPGEVIIGNNALRPVVTGRSTAFSYGIRVDGERLAQLRDERPDRREYLDGIEGYWSRWMAETGYRNPMEMHAALAYEFFVDRGVDGMREYVSQWRRRNPERDEYYGALLIVLDGIEQFILRHAEAAGEAGLDDVADVCAHISHAAPASFHEAVQLAYFIYWLCGHDSPGQIDRYLWPPLKRDLEAGRTTLAEAGELVDLLFLKYEEKTGFGATIGGKRADGSDACNDLTRLCLDSIRRLRILSPRTAFRWHRGIDAATFAQAIEVIADGASYPALVNDETMVPSLIERGIAPEHAVEYSFVGCGQTYPHGRGHGSYEDLVLNSAKPLEWALNDGVDPVTGEQVGPKTGAAESLATWDDFEAAYRRQMEDYLTRHIRGVNAYRGENAGRWVDFLRSMVSYSCVERGLDWHAGGADYSEGMVDMVGLTTLTDSLFAIRRAVYEEGRLTLAELRDALNANWDGAEALRKYLLLRVEKFGNDDAEADEFMADEFARVNDHIRSHKTVFGGPWGMDVIGWSGATVLGADTGATPDGRFRGESLADCAGPAQGRNVRGLSATLASMMKLPQGRVHGPLALSLRFTTKDVATEEGLARLRAVVEAYFLGGGQQLQISIAGTEEMKAAQLEPEKHRDLMVRVGGFSAYFTQLDRCYQDDMIARSEAAL